MSRANAQVKFPDGTIKYGIYNGTGDSYYRSLSNTQEEAWKEYYATDTLDDDYFRAYDDTYYDVEIADDYGGGHCYIGRASKSKIVSATNTDYMNLISNKLPTWWNKEK